MYFVVIRRLAVSQSQAGNRRDSQMRKKPLRIGQQHLSSMMAEGSVTKANLTHRTRLVQIDIKDHIWPRRQIKGPRGIERDTSHRFKLG